MIAAAGFMKWEREQAKKSRSKAADAGTD